MWTAVPSRRAAGDATATLAELLTHREDMSTDHSDGSAQLKDENLHDYWAPERELAAGRPASMPIVRPTSATPPETNAQRNSDSSMFAYLLERVSFCRPSESLQLPFESSEQIVKEAQQKAQQERVSGHVPATKVFGPAVGAPSARSAEGDELWQALKCSSRNFIGNLGRFLDATLLNVERNKIDNIPNNNSHLKQHPTSNSINQRCHSARRNGAIPTRSSERQGIYASQSIARQGKTQQQQRRQNLVEHGSLSCSAMENYCSQVDSNHRREGGDRPQPGVAGECKMQIFSATRKLPPPPSPWQLLAEADASIYQRHCHGDSWWKQPEIVSRPLRLPHEENLWHSLWFSLSGDARKAALMKMKKALYGGGPTSRQTLHGPLSRTCCDGGTITWRYAWASHLEITIWSVENCPLIGQIVVETDSFRHSFPFKVRFIRVPLTGDPNQGVTVWLNSGHSKPYRQRKLKLDSDDDDEEVDPLVRDALEDDFESPSDVAEANRQLISRCRHSEGDGDYLPSQDGWPTFYRLDLPACQLCTQDGFDGACLVAPQGDLYRNAGAGTTLDIFEALYSLAPSRPEDPRIKLTVRPRIRGRQVLAFAGDCTPAHLLSVLADDMPEAAQLKPGAGYKLPPGLSRKLSERDVYVGRIGDPIDMLVAIEMNRLEAFLLKNSPHDIQRIAEGVYFIGEREVKLERTIEDLELGRYKASDFRISSPDDPLFLPNAYNNMDGEFDSYAMAEENRFVLTLRVLFDDVSQLFFDFMLERPRNMEFTAMRHRSEDDTDSQHYDRSSTSDPALDIPIAELPWGVQQDTQQLSALSLHAAAIKLNIKRLEGAKVPSLNDAIWEHLQPPKLALDEFSCPVEATFIWDEATGKPMLAPVDEFDELPPHLKLP